MPAVAAAARTRGRERREFMLIRYPPPRTLTFGAGVRRLGGRDRISPFREAAFLAFRVAEAADQLRAQVIRLHHRIDHQLEGEVEDVDVLGVFTPLLGHEALTLGFALDCLDLVVE